MENPPIAPRGGSPRPILPGHDETAPGFAGFAFVTDTEPPHAAGIFVLTRRIGARLYPALIDAADDIADAIAAFARQDPAWREIDGQFWCLRPDRRQRAQIARDLIGTYNPPLNVAHRQAPAAPDIAAFLPDRAEVPGPTPPAPGGEWQLTEQDVADLVHHFYGAARCDATLGPVFARAVTDWAAHEQVVRDFWSRSLLGTQRYNGSPFTPHPGLGLTPQHFARWVALFHGSATLILPPAAAAYAIAKVEHMSRCFQAGLFLPPAAANPRKATTGMTSA